MIVQETSLKHEDQKLVNMVQRKIYSKRSVEERPNEEVIFQTPKKYNTLHLNLSDRLRNCKTWSHIQILAYVRLITLQGIEIF